MLMRSWLNYLSLRSLFNNSNVKPRFRRVKSTRAEIVEILESRQLLAAAVISGVETTVTLRDIPREPRFL